MKIFTTILLTLSTVSLGACSSTPTNEPPRESPATLTVAEADPVPYETRGEFLAAMRAELSTHDARLAELKRDATEHESIAALEQFTDRQAELIRLRERADYQLRHVQLVPEVEWRENRAEIESTLGELEDALDAASTDTLSA